MPILYGLGPKLGGAKEGRARVPSVGASVPSVVAVEPDRTVRLVTAVDGRANVRQTFVAQSQQVCISWCDRIV